MKRRNRTAAALVGVGLTLTACNSAPETAPRYFPSNVREALEEARDESIIYWKAQGVSISLRNFVFLEGEATTPNDCNTRIREGDHQYDAEDEISSGDSVPPSYCHRSESIIITPAYADIALPKDEKANSPKAAALAQVIVFHETAHHVQKKQGRYHTMADQDAERQADCYAGHMTYVYSPEHYDMAADLYAQRTDAADMLQQFNRGFNDVIGSGQTCENY